MAGEGSDMQKIGQQLGSQYLGTAAQPGYHSLADTFAVSSNRLEQIPRLTFDHVSGSF